MRAIIGLGNPGSEYDGTRHNIGFAVVNAVAEHYNITFRPGKGEYWYVAHQTTILVKPTTYMNNSGQAVKDITQRFGLLPEDLLVVFDDFHIPLGTLRLRRKGSSAGHNGMASVIWHLGSDEFPRLRCGIGSSEKPVQKSESAEFVLSGFAKQELDSVQTMVTHARDIAIIAAERDLQAALDHMSRLTY